MKARVGLAALLLLSAAPASASPGGRWLLIPKPALEPVQLASSETTVEAMQPVELAQVVSVDPTPAKPESAEPATEAEAGAEAEPKAAVASRWIAGLGAGARIGFGEPTYAEIYGRAGYAANNDVGVSIRPRYIFGNIDMAGNRNSEGAFQMPITIDVKPQGPVSPYFGAGIATNTDSTGETNAMLSGGIDFRLMNNLRADASINYIFESSKYDDNGRDIEASVVLYYKF